MSTVPVLSVRGLVTGFESDGALRPALHSVSFDVQAGRVLGLIGESGSGKTLTALSVMQLLPPRASIMAGEVLFDGQNLCALSERDMEKVRGRGIAMIFQEPVTALSPVYSVGWHLRTVLRATGQLPTALLEQRRAARNQGRELLARVELPDPELLLEAYPHQLSAGMRRRVLFAMALAGRPRLLIADEPTTGLDAPIQAQLLDLLTRLTRVEQLSAIFISHDPEVVAEVASDVVVMGGGRVVEVGPAPLVFGESQHPETRRLVESVRARHPDAVRLESARPAPGSPGAS